MTRKIRPLADRILVRKEPIKEKKSQGGLILVEEGEKGDAVVGDVLAVGEGFYDERGDLLRPLNVKVGERVLFGKYAGYACEINGESLTLMQEVDILGIIED